MLGGFEVLQIDRVSWAGHSGPDTLVELVCAELTRRAARRPIIVSTRSLTGPDGPVSTLRAALPYDDVPVFHDTPAHVPRSAVLACAAAITEAGADCVVTVGGGTPIDTVKMALLALAAGITDAAGFDRYAVRTAADGTRTVAPTPPPPLRQIVVPTTLSGAEFSDLAGCVDPETSVKQLFTAPYIGSAAVLLDPWSTLRTPSDLWFSTGIRALDHAVESLCSSAPNPLTDATAAHAVRLLAESLRRTAQAPDDLDARLRSQHAVWLACTGLNRVPWGASHGIGHQLGAVAAVPHGYCSCVMLPHVLAFNEAVTGPQQQVIRDALGAAHPSAAEAVADLVAELGLPGRLRDVGVRRDQLGEIARLSMTNMFVRQNPRHLDVADVEALLERAY